MPSMQERAKAATSAFARSLMECGEGFKVQARAAGTFFQKDGEGSFITYTTGALLTLAIPLAALPLSAGEALRGFLKPKEIQKTTT